MNYTKRVEEYQIRDVTYLGMPPKDAPIEYDIVKWAKPDKPYEAFSLDTKTNEMTKELITEYCYSVGRLVWDKRESCFEFESIGLRWLEAKPSEAVVDMILEFAEKKAKELEVEDD